jgi:hypothetical protein
MTEEGSSSISGALGLADGETPPVDRDRISPIRIVRALVRLACARGRLAHVPTLGQVRGDGVVRRTGAVLLHGT